MKAYVMVGAQGSGKSTYAGELVLGENATIISGDSIREDLFGTAPVQDIPDGWAQIHDKIEEYVAECAGHGWPLVIDGTHYSARSRGETIALLRSYGYSKIEAIVLDVSLATCLDRNSKRPRPVPEHIVEKTHQKLLRSLKHIDSEDFDHITYVY
jgi:predicted kinase